MFDRIPLYGQSRTRVKQLSTKLAASPVLPVLGYTKVAETIVAGGPTLNWAVYAVAVTFLWIFADDIQESAEEVTENVQGVVDEDS